MKEAIESKNPCEVLESNVAVPVLGGFEIRHNDNVSMGLRYRA